MRRLGKAHRRLCVRLFLVTILASAFLTVIVLLQVRHVNHDDDDQVKHSLEFAHVSSSCSVVGNSSHFHDRQKCPPPCKFWQCDDIEDVFCLEKPEYLANYKNPCWYEQTDNEKFRLMCLPYFHVLGVDKSGSTDLFARIAQHPQVLNNSGGIGKETYFWCWTRVGIWMKNTTNFSKFTTLHYYAQQFFGRAAEEIQKHSDTGYHKLVTGDGTPIDFWDMRGWPKLPQNRGLREPVVLTPHLMKHVYRHPKFIVIFRDPTDRLYSDYYFLGYGETPQSFHRHALQAVEMMQSCFQRTGSQRLCIYDADMYAKLPMRIHIGCYSIFLKEWLSVFPRENFLFLKNEEYSVSMYETLAEVFRFLQLDPAPDTVMEAIVHQAHHHVTKWRSNKRPMLNETRELLDEFYAPFKKEMATMLSDDRWLWRLKENTGLVA